MSARAALGLFAELADLDAKRAALVEELRKAVWKDTSPGERVATDRALRVVIGSALDEDALDRKIRTDPILRDIFRPAEEVAEQVRRIEAGAGFVIEHGNQKYFLPFRKGVDGNPAVRCVSQDGCTKYYPDCVHAGSCRFGEIDF